MAYFGEKGKRAVEELQAIIEKYEEIEGYKAPKNNEWGPCLLYQEIRRLESELEFRDINKVQREVDWYHYTKTDLKKRLKRLKLWHKLMNIIY